jgi:hypothetical protein
MTTALPPMHPNNALILWNEASDKWQNTGNDFFCQQVRGSEKWRVSARYGFAGTEDQNGGRRVSEYEFDTQIEAMQFYVNFLVDRAMKSMEDHRRAA